MKRLMILLCMVAVVGLAAAAQASVATWYEFSFTGADLWNSSATNTADDTGIPQTAPRRYSDSFKASGISTTWNYDGNPAGEVGTLGSSTGSGTTSDFNVWKASAAGNAFAINGLNLWGADATNAKTIFGEKYLSQTTDPSDSGRSSWAFVEGPANWTESKFRIDEDLGWGLPGYSLIEWDNATGANLTQANMNSFVFTFDVLISNPAGAFEPDGSMRVWFGASGTNGGTMDGVMELHAIPEPTTILVWGLLGMVAAGYGVWRRRRAK